MLIKYKLKKINKRTLAFSISVGFALIAIYIDFEVGNKVIDYEPFLAVAIFTLFMKEQEFKWL